MCAAGARGASAHVVLWAYFSQALRACWAPVSSPLSPCCCPPPCMGSVCLLRRVPAFCWWELKPCTSGVQISCLLSQCGVAALSLAPSGPALVMTVAAFFGHQTARPLREGQAGLLCTVVVCAQKLAPGRARLCPLRSPWLPIADAVEIILTSDFSLRSGFLFSY